MEYRWKSGTRISCDANVAGAMCKQLEMSGGLTAKALLDANRAEGTPLHDAFEWDDSTAAEAFREDQARHIIRSLVVVSESAEPVRGFFNIVQAEPQYHSVEAILRSPDRTEQLMKSALRELQAFKAKYQALEQLTQVFLAIDAVSESMKESA